MMMLTRTVLGLGLVFTHLPPLAPQDEMRGPPAAVIAEPLPGYALMEKVREFCFANPADCMEIAENVSGAGAAAAKFVAPAMAPIVRPVSRDTLTASDRAAPPATHAVAHPAVTEERRRAR